MSTLSSAAAMENIATLFKNKPSDILMAFLDNEDQISLDTNEIHRKALEKLISEVIKSSARSIGILYEIMQKCFEKKHSLAMKIGLELSTHLVGKLNKRKISVQEKKKKEKEEQGDLASAARKRWPPGIPKIDKPVDMCEIIVNKPDKFSNEAVLRARLYLRQIKKAVPPTRANMILSQFKFKEGLPLNVTPRTPIVPPQIGSKLVGVKRRRENKKDNDDDGDDDDDRGEDDDDRGDGDDRGEDDDDD